MRELEDGSLEIIDGHLRAAMDPDHEVDVEVLDVNDAEARALLLAIDPLAQLAGYEADTLAALREVVERDSAALKSLWEVLAEASARTKQNLDKQAPPAEQFLVVIACADEAEQRVLLRRFQKEGLRCEAKVA